ncbi:heterogeneous nuclear ribonucleoprotein K-like isoform X1 [Haliotis asinina]|uniref:heterogeneous nuclear ribonucleoprotein K-like isoform X1 n=2 Tax=Haliotis asinina TaxID=109174 RepID=UPI003531C85C
MSEGMEGLEGRMKRPLDEGGEEEEGNCGAPKRQRGEGPKVDLRVLIQSKNAGAIIGKGGVNIKRLRSDFKATVTVPDSDGPERILSVSADLGTVLECILDVIPNLEEYKNHDGMDFDCEMRMLVHQSQAGCIIGRAGFKIKELREKTGANIKVYSQCCPQSTDRVVMISGKPKIVVGCIEEVFETLQQAPPKGPIQPYDPHNYDEFFAHEYGGFTSAEGGRGKGGPRGAPPPPPRGNFGMRGGRGRMGMNDFGMGGGMNMGFGRGGRGRGGMMGRGGMRGGMGGGMGGMGAGMDNDMSEMGGGSFGMAFGQGTSRGSMGGRGGMRGSPNGNMGGGGGNMNRGGSGGQGDFSSPKSLLADVEQGMGGSFNQGGGMHDFGDDMGGMGNQGMMFDEKTNSTQVTIPKDMAGAIIGKGGSRIMDIRRQSNAQIVIDEALPGSNDRIITITGTPDQIQNAQYLLQMRLRGQMQQAGGVKKYSGKY